MAYMDQQKKKELAPGIKAVLKKYGMKGTIGVRNHMVLVVNIKSGKLDILGNYVENNEEAVKKYEKSYPTYMQVNEYAINEWYSGKVRDFLNELKTAMNVGNYDNSDIQSDYFCRGFYTDINIGQWDKPYILEA